MSHKKSDEVVEEVNCSNYSDDGYNPHEEPGSEECDATADRCEVSAFYFAEGTTDTCDFTTQDEIEDQFPIEEIPVILDPRDGLPTIVTPDPKNAEAIPFTYDNVICICDDREYVEVFYDELEERGIHPGNIENNDSVSFAKFVRKNETGFMVIGQWTLANQLQYNQYGEENDRRKFKKSEVKKLFGHDVAEVKIENMPLVPIYVVVRPRREVCKYYKRQVFPNEEVPNKDEYGHEIVHRNCTIRRSNGGAFLSLRDEGVYMCDYRDPPDPLSSIRQNQKDYEKLNKKPHLVRVPMFGMSGEEIHLPDDDHSCEGLSGKEICFPDDEMPVKEICFPDSDEEETE